MSAGHSGAATRARLEEFVDHYLKTWPELTAAWDPDWRSACELGPPYTAAGASDRLVRWRPLPRPPANDFAGLAHALDTPIHPDIRAYYEAFWSGHLEAEAPEGHVSLLLLWNDADVDRLIENLIGHALAQRRSRSGLSLFFGCTEPESDLFLTVRNDTGEVQLERPGYRPIRTVAPSLASFLERLVPAPPAVPMPAPSAVPVRTPPGAVPHTPG